MKQLELSFIADRNEKQPSSFGKHLEVSYKVKHMAPLQLSNPTSRYVSEKLSVSVHKIKMCTTFQR